MAAVLVRRTVIQVVNSLLKSTISTIRDQLYYKRTISTAGVADVEIGPCPYQSPQTETHTEAHLKRSALSNSLLDMHEQCKCVDHVNMTIV